jgi:hypothetical protein
MSASSGVRLATQLVVAASTVAGLTAASGLVALATHAPQVAAVVATATGNWSMTCVPAAGQVRCDASDVDGTWHSQAIVTPASGNLTSLSTAAAVFVTPLDSFFRSWMTSLLGVACAPSRTAAGQLASFVAAVGNLSRAGTESPLTIPGECNLSGGLSTVTRPDGRTEFDYWVNAVVVRPTPTPTPNPKPSPSSTPTPAPPPTANASASPRPSPTPTRRPAPTISPSPATINGTSSPSGDAATPPEASPWGSASPDSTGKGPSDSPSPAAPASAAPASAATDDPAGPGPGPGTGEVAGIQTSGEPPIADAPWVHSVPAAAGVRSDPGTAGVAAAAVLALLLAMGFVGELFNNTLESNYDRIVAWWRNGPLGRLLRVVRSRGGGA